MSKKKNKKFKPNQSMLKNGIYATKGSKNNRSLMKQETNIELNKNEGKEIKKNKKMKKIEDYAKEKVITIAQAMIYFM